MSAMTYDTSVRPIDPSAEGVSAIAKYRPRENTPRTVAKALGWFSLALGLTELVASEQLARTIGIRSYPRLLPAFGLREIASGLAIFGAADPTNAVRSRVVGDALDLAFLATELAAAPQAERARVAAATAAVLSVTAADVWCAAKLSGRA
jgi:hypothetical protein